MKKKIKYLILFSGLFLLVLFATSFALSAEKITIAMVPKSLDNPVFLATKVGAEKAALDYGFELIWVGPVQDEAVQQGLVVQDLINKKVDAIGVSVSLAESMTPIIEDATRAGIPVITWDSDAHESTRSIYFGTENYQGGRKVGELLIEALNGKGEVAVWSVVAGAPNLDERVQGVMDILKEKAPEIEVIQRVTAGAVEVGKSIQAFEDFTRSHPELDGWAVVDGLPFFSEPGAMPTVEERAKSGKLKIIAFDAIESQLKYVEEGIVEALVGQKYYGWGYDGSVLAYCLAISKPLYHSLLKNPIIVDAGLDIVTKDGRNDTISLAEMVERWESYK